VDRALDPERYTETPQILSAQLQQTPWPSIVSSVVSIQLTPASLIQVGELCPGSAEAAPEQVFESSSTLTPVRSTVQITSHETARGHSLSPSMECFGGLTGLRTKATLEQPTKQLK
jgi:hypothetical protein